MVSEKEKQWIEIYLETGDAKEAVRQVFNVVYVDARASQLKAKLALDIDKALRSNFACNAVIYNKIISGLASKAKSEQVQLKACQDMLDRGGYKPVDKTEDVTVPKTKEQVELEYKEALESAVKAMPKEELDRIRTEH